MPDRCRLRFHPRILAFSTEVQCTVMTVASRRRNRRPWIRHTRASLRSKELSGHVHLHPRPCPPQPSAQPDTRRSGRPAALRPVGAGFPRVWYFYPPADSAAQQAEQV